MDEQSSQNISKKIWICTMLHVPIKFIEIQLILCHNLADKHKFTGKNLHLSSFHLGEAIVSEKKVFCFMLIL